MLAVGADASPPPGNEPLRPRFHFTPPTGWMNDPNGLVYYRGEYHLFYQYHPHSTVWGPMHWGHAVSRDLVHWQHLPVALAPGADGYVFSGSAVTDRANSVGFGKGALVALFTLHDPAGEAAKTGRHQSQALATSLDRGRTWQRFPGNPVLPNPGGKPDFRDPSVFWHAPGKRWIMVLAAHDHIELYASADLRDWRYLSSFGEGIGAHGGVWECPNLFPLRISKSGETRWVLLQSIGEGGPQGGSGTQYFVGDFDGTRFVADPDFLAGIARDGPAWLDHGHDNYAGITWNDAPRGERLFIGWMSNWRYATKVPTHPWRSAMTAPRRLSLVRDADGYRLTNEPVDALAALRKAAFTINPGGKLPSGLASGGELDLRIEARPGSEGGLTIELSNRRGERLQFGLDSQRGWFVDRRHAGQSAWHPEFASLAQAPRALTTRTATLRVLIDRSSVELFADGGRVVLTETLFPSEPFATASIRQTGEYRLTNGRAWLLGDGHGNNSVIQEVEDDVP